MPTIYSIILVLTLFYFEIEWIPATIIWFMWFVFGYSLFKAGVRIQITDTYNIIQKKIIENEFKKLDKNESSYD